MPDSRWSGTAEKWHVASPVLDASRREILHRGVVCTPGFLTGGGGGGCFFSISREKGVNSNIFNADKSRNKWVKNRRNSDNYRGGRGIRGQSGAAKGRLGGGGVGLAFCGHDGMTVMGEKGFAYSPMTPCNPFQTLKRRCIEAEANRAPV